jgi:hypothetical protein
LLTAGKVIACLFKIALSLRGLECAAEGVSGMIEDDLLSLGSIQDLQSVVEAAKEVFDDDISSIRSICSNAHEALGSLCRNFRQLRVLPNNAPAWFPGGACRKKFRPRGLLLLLPPRHVSPRLNWLSWMSSRISFSRNEQCSSRSCHWTQVFCLLQVRMRNRGLLPSFNLLARFYRPFTSPQLT